MKPWIPAFAGMTAKAETKATAATATPQSFKSLDIRLRRSKAEPAFAEMTEKSRNANRNTATPQHHESFKSLDSRIRGNDEQKQTPLAASQR
ncbi:hypothetical protein [Lysobacter capsici]|uniref:hypothetical protein n=1 Tax=Lysobacter capsici TaxID=435897 RepID=UPI0012FE02C7|nr:hypothetical protein [Lysobacter capsici]